MDDLPTYTVEQLKERLTVPCVHRGALLQANPECGCKSIHECDIHGQCVPTTHGKIKACFTCHEYIAKPFDMKTLFDRVVLINLKRRPDRLTQFREQTKDWPFLEPTIFEAIDGNAVPTPVGWTMGGGTWGCLQSHRQILERAIMDNVQSLLVLEDDLTAPADYIERLDKFLRAVPADWEQLMLGGQHTTAPKRTDIDGVLKCVNAQRTHAYAIRGRFLRDLYAKWCSHTSQVHCDWIMGPMQAKYKVYAPSEFIFGQGHGQSDINGRVNPAKTWNPPKGDEPILLLRGPREVVEKLREYGIHIGFDRLPDTGYDRGLHAAVNAPHLLAKWCNDLQWEATAEGTTLAAWHPKLKIEALQAAWSGPAREIDVSTLSMAMEALGGPARRSRASQAVVLLRGSREVAQALQGRGWHGGYWRDTNTGFDRGLTSWLASGKVTIQLTSIIELLKTEAQNIPNGIVCVWHPEMKADMLRGATDTPVIEIEAESVEDAETKLHAALTASK